MKKISKARQKGLKRNAKARWNGLAMILKLCARVQHTENVAPVIDCYEGVIAMASNKNL